MPTAPSEWTESPWKRVYGLPDTNGVDVAISPSFRSVSRVRLDVTILPTFVAASNLDSALLSPSGAPSVK